MAVFNVTNLDDSGAGSLRQAIFDANGLLGADTIEFSGVTGTITLTSGELSITDSLTINGPGADLLSISGNNASRVFRIIGSIRNVDATINGLTITGGGNLSGGGITSGADNLNITNSTISGNSGTGVFNYGNISITNSTISGNYLNGVHNNYGNISITNSTISGNYLNGVSNYGNSTITNSTIFGNYLNGVFNYGNSTITNSTISGNYRGVLNSFYGSYNGVSSITNSTISGNSRTGVVSYGGVNTITNSTISGNFGAGVIMSDNIISSITNSTISENLGDGVITSGISSIINSTISGNRIGLRHSTDRNNVYLITNTIIANSINGPDCLNLTITTNINNLIEDGTCNPSLSGDPNLGPLQDNGGPTFTQALLPGSIAINAGSNAGVPLDVIYDQRGPGFPRIIGGRVDIGAYEAIPEPLTLLGVATATAFGIAFRRKRK